MSSGIELDDKTISDSSESDMVARYRMYGNERQNVNNRLGTMVEENKFDT